MRIEVVEALDKDRVVVRHLLQLYHYDSSEFDGDDVDDHGEYLHRYFDEYWLDSDRCAFLIPGRPCLGRLCSGVHWATEGRGGVFFVMPRSIATKAWGVYAARQIFASYPGEWTVRQQVTNPHRFCLLA